MAKQDFIKILYIEDDIGSRLLIRKVLGKPPFEVLEAATGLAGLDAAMKEHPDLILMDIDLPDIRGNELTTKIKNTPDLKEVIIVALTAMKDKDAREMTLVAGCDGFLTKPIDIQTFPKQILQFLEGKKEVIDAEIEKTYHSQYEVSLVDRLTSKVQELEITNKKLETTSKRLQGYNEYLENVLSIFSALQQTASPDDLKKALVNEVCDRFKYDRCAFIDVDDQNMMMRVSYARGFDPEDWKKFQYPYKSPVFQKLFKDRQVLLMPNLNLVEDPKLRRLLESIDSHQFMFAYLGTPVGQMRPADIRRRVLPLLESYMPSLHDQEDSDIDVILANLEEYLASESLYRAGFIFMDNYKSKRRILPNEFRFLETLLRTTSYVYQNVLLMEQLRFLFVRAEKEAITDPLTDLFNYRYFMQQLNREISRDQRHKSVFSLIMIDIDFFKNYNDAHGHQAGDLILQRIAKEMMENTRVSDIVCRYGGEEFVIICPELEKRAALQMAEKLRQIVENIELPSIENHEKSKLTISSGVASFPDDGETAFRLIRNADKALYKAKDAGRNRVCVLAED
jgi:diguanylate cyclase (GGDEF)-like protein